MPQDGIVTVFVSSTWIDLGPERRAVEFVLSRFDETKLVGMEHFGSRPETTRNASLREVDRSDLYVGIIGPRYGSGITEEEYERARQNGVPCLFYVKTPVVADPADGSEGRRQRFLDRVQTAHTVSNFSSANELETCLAIDLHKWLSTQKLRVRREEGKGEKELDAVAARVHQAWIKGVLERAVSGERRIQLGFSPESEALDAIWARQVTILEEGTPTPRPPDDAIAKIFADASQSLLILGEPGSGKTMTLLELTRDLLHFYTARVERAVPVVLSLASWKPAPRGLLDWAVAELRSQYFVPRALAEQWLNEGRLHLMLDGLDEVPEARRAACVDSVNAFLQDGKTAGVAVTCRVEEYQSLGTRFTFYGAIRLLPLDDQRIAKYLAAFGPTSDVLQSRMSVDSDLHELARSPLMLNVMSAAMQGSWAESLTAGSGVETLRSRLFALYVSGMFKRRRMKGGEEGRTLQSLVWLASEMHRNSWTVFSLDRLQPRLLTSVPATMAYALTASLATVVIGLGALMLNARQDSRQFLSCVLGLAAVDVLRLATADRIEVRAPLAATVRPIYLMLYFAVPVGVARMTGSASDVGAFILMMWVFVGWRIAWRGRDDDVRLMDQIGWRWSSALRGAILACVVINIMFEVSCATVSTGNEGWIAFFEALRKGILRTVVSPGEFVASPLTVALEALQALARWIGPFSVGAVMGGMQPRMSPGPARVYGRFRATLLRSVIGGSCFAVAFHLTFSDTDDVLQFGPAAEIFVLYFPLGFIWFGGFELIRHLSVRLMLAATRRFPFASVRLLNEAVGLAFVRRAGSGYVFMHRLLLEHFAGLDRRSEPAVH